MGIERYAAQVYAGVLGKMIGVYLGRPVEGWSYDKIQNVFGEVVYYVHDRIGAPLVVADDDLSGTFGFFRVLEDNGYPPDLTPQQVGQTWLNYIIEDKTILWWGGLGRSTEHTAYLRLRDGIPAPRSGSIALNGPTIAQQIGAQIFMDAFAMASPGDPERAVAMVRAAASVSHDGIAVEAAGFLAAMEALAFDVHALDDLIEGALPYVTSATLKHLIDDVRTICARESDWRAVRAWLDPRYGYDVCPGPCHIIPNHAMVLSALLLGGDDFQRSIMIGASAAWDTDCNAGNVGCLNGIRLGLDGLHGGADFRTPVADLLLVVTADGGACVTDAVQQTKGIIRVAAALRGEPVAERGPRYGFDYPGSTQGFVPCPYGDAPYPVARVSNLNEISDENGLAIEYCALAVGAACRVSTPTFLDFSVLANNFATIASPTLYATQTVRSRVKAFADENPRLRFYVLVYDSDNAVSRLEGDLFDLVRGVNTLAWTVPDTGGMPIFRLGIELVADKRLDGRIGVLDLDWDGAPAAFAQQGMLMTSIWNLTPYWLQAWVSSARQFAPDFKYTYCVSHTADNGVVTMGTQDWSDYSVESGIAFSLHQTGGLVLRSKGHRRYYAAILSGGRTASIIARRDDVVETLATVDLPYEMDRVYALRFEARGNSLALTIDGGRILETHDPSGHYVRGGAGFVVDRGTLLADGFRVAAL